MQLNLGRIIKTLLTLLVLTSTSASAGYVDIGTTESAEIRTKFYADGFIIDARKGDTDRLGIGYGHQEKELEFYFGLGGTSNDQVYAFSEFVYRNGRHSIYDLSIDYVNDKPAASIGYTHLLSENFGVIAKHNFTENRLFIGIRKWIK